MSRRAKGEGSVFFNSNKNKWQVAFSHGVDEKGKRKRKILTADSEAGAWKVYEDFKALHGERVAEVGRGVENAPQEAPGGSRVTLAMAYDEYLEIERGKSGRGFKTKLGTCKPVIEKLGHYELSELTAGIIERFFSNLVNETYKKGESENYYSQAYIDKVYMYFKATLKLAKRNKYISDNLMEEVSKPRQNSRIINKTEKAYTDIELDNLMRAVEHDQMWYTIVTIMRYTGIRPGEMAALKWSDFKDGFLHIERAISLDTEYDSTTRKCGRDETIIKDLKNNDPRRRNNEITACRKLKLNQTVLEAVKNWERFTRQAIVENKRLISGNEYTGSKGKSFQKLKEMNGTQDFLFVVRSRSNLMSPDYLANEYRKYLGKQGLDSKEYNLYRLRHTFCTLALKATGNDFKMVQILMGDSDQTMILRIYNTIRKEEVYRGTDSILARIESHTTIK